MDREQVKKQLPSITEHQLNILEFWAVRGWEDISHCLGMSIDLKRQQRFQNLGLELIYLEQFYKEAQNDLIEKINKLIDKAGESGYVDLEELKNAISEKDGGKE